MRTGTLPFMAIDALKPDVKRHLERFVWESFMWALIWITGRYEPGKNECDSKRFSEWLYGSSRRIKQEKWSFLTSWDSVGKDLSCKGYYGDVFLKWCLPMCEAFEDSYFARQRATLRSRSRQEYLDKDGELDESKVPDQVSYQSLWSILADECEPVIDVE